MPYNNLMKPAVFLDRDGTLIEHVPYLSEMSQIKLVSHAVDALKILRDIGFSIVVVSNQSGVARGYFDEPFVQACHKEIERMLEDEGASIDGYYYCPHHPLFGAPPYKKQCLCRKPSPGLVMQAVRDLALNLSLSWVVGDNEPDLLLSQNVGCPFILVRTGYGRTMEEKSNGDLPTGTVVDGLYEAALYIQSLCE